ncbi:unnamed protein product [Effrenium voratum]|uniref:Alcohol dehydrogenase iron-type/glycerol dehydrogenase GldA domain-containing protein n=1 Tax=Effrenium voratum TaxID=2562239 RepID=A0AA36HYB3_9DINO|nr:unnamed protein product [Effrenium voratum]CAJ1457244.1 unnamed protein product [Effrenium voratum]
MAFSHGEVYNPHGCKCMPRMPGDSCPKVLVAPPHYIQGPNIMPSLGRYVSKLLGCRKVGMLIIPFGRSAWEPGIVEGFKDHGISWDVQTFDGAPSYEAVDHLVGIWEKEGLEALVAVGGGTCGDCAKLVAFKLKVPLVNVSTLAATDAPCSALSIMYTVEGAYRGGEVYPQSPNIVAVDTAVIASAGKRSLVSGFGDAMSTYYEARTCYENPKGLSMLEARPTETAMAIGALCAKMLYENAQEALLAVEAKQPNEALEKVVEANTLLSGLGFESGGLSASHAVAQALSWVHSVHDNLMHGEMVAIGLLTMLTMEDIKGLPGRKDEYRKVAEFFSKVGLPVCLKHAFFDPNDQKAIDTFTRVTLDQWFCHNEPFPVSEDLILQSVMEADKKGKAIVSELGDAAYRAIHGGLSKI